MESKSYISLGELARRSGLPTSWLKAEAKAGRLPHLRAGRRMMFNAEVVIRVLDERAQQQDQEKGGGQS